MVLWAHSYRGPGGQHPHIYSSPIQKILTNTF